MRDKQFHQEMIDNIEGYTKRFTIVRGMCDIVEKKFVFSHLVVTMLLLTMIIGLCWVI